MAAKDQKVKESTEETAIPEPRSAEQSQIIPVGSMNRDPRTGAELLVGLPETDDEQDIADFILWLAEKADEGNVDEMAMLAQMLRQANTAETVADALRGKYLVNGKDHVGVPFMCTGFTIHEGKYEDETLPYFASLECINPDHPEGYVANCGGMKILVHLRTFERFSSFPIPLMFTGSPTRKGRIVLNFEVLQQTKP